MAEDSSRHGGWRYASRCKWYVDGQSGLDVGPVVDGRDAGAEVHSLVSRPNYGSAEYLLLFRPSDREEEFSTEG